MFEKSLSDQEILLAIKAGRDDRALEQLYKELFPKVRRIVSKYNTRGIDAYDIFQESILRFYDYVKQNKFNEKQSIDAFVITVAKNKTIDYLRKNSSKFEASMEDGMTESYEVPETNILEMTEKNESLKAIFSTIGEKCKELLLLSVFDRRSMVEIAETLGFSSENSAKTQNYKCKQKLIKALAANPELAKEVMAYA